MQKWVDLGDGCIFLKYWYWRLQSSAKGDLSGIKQVASLGTVANGLSLGVFDGQQAHLAC